MKMNEQRPKPEVNKNTLSWLLDIITVCPQIIQPEIGTKAFVEDLVKSAAKFSAYQPETVGATGDLLPFIRACPQVIKPGTGIEVFLEEWESAATIFAMST